MIFVKHHLVLQIGLVSDLGGFIDLEYGDYEHLRLKAALNVPLSDSVALRIAGYSLDRDGYIDNTAYGQTSVLDGVSKLRGIDGDVDAGMTIVIGFNNEASNYDPSSVFYDNVRVIRAE